MIDDLLFEEMIFIFEITDEKNKGLMISNCLDGANYIFQDESVTIFIS